MTVTVTRLLKEQLNFKYKRKKKACGIEPISQTCVNVREGNGPMRKMTIDKKNRLVTHSFPRFFFLILRVY